MNAHRAPDSKGARPASNPSPCPEELFQVELDLRSAGYLRIAGLDEAGRGPLFGPVVAAAAILPEERPPVVLGDSKQLTERQREVAYKWLRAHSAFGIGLAHAWEIDEINILEATRRAMVRAVLQLRMLPDCLIIDALSIPALPDIPQFPMIRADSRSASVAAASILAKVTRDRLMRIYHLRFPQFGFDKHKGYPTAQHRAAVAQFGPLPLHRKSFRGVRELLEHPHARNGFTEPR